MRRLFCVAWSLRVAWARPWVVVFVGPLGGLFCPLASVFFWSWFVSRFSQQGSEPRKSQVAEWSGFCSLPLAIFVTLAKKKTAAKAFDAFQGSDPFRGQGHVSWVWHVCLLAGCFVGSWLVLLFSFAEFCQVLPGVARCCQVLPGVARCCQVLPGVARCCQVVA